MPTTIHNELRDFLAAAKLPSSPALAAKILELADDPHATVAQFADVIRLDAALAARLLKMTNSAACAQTTPVTTIERAIGLLGINRVRTVSLGFQLIGHTNRLGKCPFDMKVFWQRSVLRGCLARSLADEVIPACAEEAFLVGLLQDCGIPLLAQLLGASYAELCMEGLSPADFHAAEKSRFTHDHVQASCALAREWRLPDCLVAYIQHQHTEPSLAGEASDADKLCAISYVAGSIQWSGKEAGTGDKSALSSIASTLGVQGDTLERCIQAAGEAYREMHQILDNVLPDDLDVTDLLGRANAHLSATVERERRQAAEEHAHLECALGEYRERAARDPLTGLLNRGALTDALSLMIPEAAAEGQPLLFLFLDIDDFKAVNDTLGHKVGDAVLIEIAKTLQARVSHAGVLGRYGGEEFVLAIGDVNEFESHALTGAIIEAVRRMNFEKLGLGEPVSCSVGAVWGVPDANMAVEQLVNIADQQMYRAKRSGKGRSCFQLLRSDEAEASTLSSFGALDECVAILEESATRDAGGHVPPEEFRRVAAEMNQHTPQRFLEMRKHLRKDLIVPCRIRSFLPGTLELACDDAYVRDVSAGGLGLLTPRRLTRGQPTEVTLLWKGAARLYIAGTIAFSRHVEAAIHETGLQLLVHSKKPILSEDPIRAIRELDWVDNAIRVMQQATDAPPELAEYP